MQVIEKKGKSSCRFLDYAKSFDTVNHKILLSKLQHYPIRGHTLLSFKSYLSNRKLTTRIVQIRTFKPSFQKFLREVH